MNKIQVRIDTQKDVRDFVGVATSISNSVFLEDGTGFRVDAKSLMGVMYGTSEFSNLYVLSDCDTLETKFSKFLV